MQFRTQIAVKLHIHDLAVQLARFAEQMRFQQAARKSGRRPHTGAGVPGRLRVPVSNMSAVAGNLEWSAAIRGVIRKDRCSDILVIIYYFKCKLLIVFEETTSNKGIKSQHEV